MIDQPMLYLEVRNAFDKAYGQVDPRTTIAPGTPFLTFYHPQESRNIVVGINYHF